MGVFDIFKKPQSSNQIGFTLENVRLRNQADPRHFLIPTVEELAGLQVGDQVRLIFLLDKELENGCNGERMWVELTEIDGENYKGLLTNQPQFITTLQIADEVHFAAEHIATIITPTPAYDVQQLAIVSLDCLERQEINWAIKNEALHHERDSGWSFFTGWESPEEQENPDKARLITIDDVLMIEPLLETVLDKAGEAYYYDKNLNQFVEDSN